MNFPKYQWSDVHNLLLCLLQIVPIEEELPHCVWYVKNIAGQFSQVRVEKN
jgi:hypothetical protein